VRRRKAVAVAFVTATLLTGIVVIQAIRGKAATSERAARAPIADAFAGLPRPPRPAFTVGRPALLDRRESRARFAPVLRRVDARTEPNAEAPPVATVTERTEEGTTNILLVLSEARRQGAAWVHVRLPVLPNNRTGWVPRSALGGYRFVDTHLTVDLNRFTVTLLRDGRPVFRASVGIGRSAWPTPKGDFYIRNRLSGFGDPFYGPIAFGTSARSAVLTDWPGGGFVGIHGTNEPELIPGRISHGCIRLRNDDIVRLARLMPVGTPLTIR
jgi:hypothetical protein